MAEARKHVLLWLAPEFLQSAGMVRILREAEFLSLPETEWDELIQSAEEAGGFALGGRLVETHHGAGVWISPENDQGLELMIPWAYVKGVLTGQEPQAAKIFGLTERAVARNGQPRPQGRG